MGIDVQYRIDYVYCAMDPCVMRHPSLFVSASATSDVKLSPALPGFVAVFVVVTVFLLLLFLRVLVVIEAVKIVVVIAVE